MKTKKTEDRVSGETLLPRSQISPFTWGNCILANCIFATYLRAYKSVEEDLKEYVEERIQTNIHKEVQKR